MSRIEIKEFAKQKIKGNMWEILGACIVVAIISGAFSTTTVLRDGENVKTTFNIVSILGDMLVFILNIGVTAYMVNFVTDKSYEFGQVFSKFKNWKQILITYWHRMIMLVLYTLLLIIPGLIKGFAYALVPYILADDNEMTSTEILKLSEKMMDGHKMDLFVLSLSFIGWHFLAIFTFGLLELWIIPYQRTAITKFLNDIKENYNSNISISEQLA